MLSISPTNEWRSAHPGALIGFLELSAVTQPASSPALDEQLRRIEENIRLFSPSAIVERRELLAA